MTCEKLCILSCDGMLRAGDFVLYFSGCPNLSNGNGKRTKMTGNNRLILLGFCGKYQQNHPCDILEKISLDWS